MNPNDTFWTVSGHIDGVRQFETSYGAYLFYNVLIEKGTYVEAPQIVRHVVVRQHTEGDIYEDDNESLDV